jgi:hypothetical protein
MDLSLSLEKRATGLADGSVHGVERSCVGGSPCLYAGVEQGERAMEDSGGELTPLSYRVEHPDQVRLLFSQDSALFPTRSRCNLGKRWRCVAHPQSAGDPGYELGSLLIEGSDLAQCRRFLLHDLSEIVDGEGPDGGLLTGSQARQSVQLAQQGVQKLAESGKINGHLSFVLGHRLPCVDVGDIAA